LKNIAGWEFQKYWTPIENGVQKWLFVHINKCGGMSIEHRLNIPKIHYTAQDLVDRLGREKWDEMFTFSVIRHPYARVLSLYNYRAYERRLGFYPPEVNNWIQSCFVKKEENVWLWSRMQEPMVNWLKVDGEIAVNKIYRLENIEKDWLDICDKTGAKERTLKHINRRLGTTTEDAIQAFNDESIHVLNEHFKEDFEVFDYEIKKV